MYQISVIKAMTSNELLEQYDINADLVEKYWDDANDGSGDWEQPLDNMNECKEACKQLKAEILERKANNTLYDGKREVIVKVWMWAKDKAEDYDHCYNMVRKVMWNKHNVYMLKAWNAGIFDNK